MLKRLHHFPIRSDGFREITNDSLSTRRVFVEDVLKPQFKFTAEKSIQRAQELQRISNAFVRAGLPVQQVIHRSGNLTMQNFVLGTFLPKGPLANRHLYQVARILAQMHSLRKPSGVPSASLSQIAQEVRKVPKQLFDMGILDVSVQKQLTVFLRKHMPLDAVQVLTHRDVTFRNIIQKGKKLMLIDIGDAGLDFAGLELARTIYNLRLNKTQTTAFLTAYKRFGGNPAHYLSDRAFWDAYIRMRKLRRRAQKNQTRRVAIEKRALATLISR